MEVWTTTFPFSKGFWIHRIAVSDSSPCFLVLQGLESHQVCSIIRRNIPDKLHRHSRHSPWKCDTPCSPSPPNKKTLLGSFKNHPTIMWLREAQKLNRLVLTVDSILPYESLNAPVPMGLKLKCRGISLFQLVKCWETGSIHPPNLLNAWQVEKNHQLKYIYLSWRSNLLQPKKQWVKHFNDFSNKALLVYMFTAVFHPNLSPPSLHRPTLPFQSSPDG